MTPATVSGTMWSLPTGTVLFLSGNGTLYFHSNNAQVDALYRDCNSNPLVSDAAYPQRQR